MNSSDSDDDCYGNIAQKLQLIKNKYQKDKPDNSLNDSADFSTCNKIVSDPSNAPFILIEDENVPLGDSEEVTIDSIIAKNIKKRITRSTAKQLQIDVLVEKPSRRNKKLTPVENDTIPNAKSTTEKTRSNRGRGGRRKQTERSRSRRTAARTASEGDQNIPTYSVGNTECYPDFSDNQQLFTTQNPVETVVIKEDTIQSINEELSVKVFWQSSEYRTFMIRRYQKFTEIYDYYAKKANVSYDNLIFMYNDKIIRIDDTPEKINYNIVKFIEGGITSEKLSSFMMNKNVNIKDGIKLKFRYENVKKPFEVIVKGDESLSLAMIQCAEHFEVPLQKLKFIFDGDYFTGTTTPNDLELEGGECIDIKMTS